MQLHSWQDVEKQALAAISKSPMGQQALQLWVDAKMQLMETYAFAQEVRYHLGSLGRMQTTSCGGHWM